MSAAYRFTVRLPSGRLARDEHKHIRYFRRKKDAKEFRDLLNEGKPDHELATVAPGPTHPRWRG